MSGGPGVTVGALVEHLALIAAGGAGQLFGLDLATRRLAHAAHAHHTSSARPRAVPRTAVRELHRLRVELQDLDRWAAVVATALATADTTGAHRLWRHLLALGPGHPELLRPPGGGDAHAVTGGVDVTRLTAAELGSLATAPWAPPTFVDRVNRERARRWLAALPVRLALLEARPRAPYGPVTRWLDAHVVGLTDPVVDLHLSVEDDRARLRAEAAGLRLVLGWPDVRLLAFEPAGPGPLGAPTARLAFGSPDTASDVAVLLAGTGSGLAAPRTALTDASALHAAMASRRPDGSTTVVLELYGAPPDLGRAADRAFGEAAAGALAPALSTIVPSDARLTLVGHSYGAFTAGLTARESAAHGRPADGVVLLGAPGAGVLHADDLRLATGGTSWAMRAPGDPIVLVADLDEHVRAVDPGGAGPLHAPDVALGPDPMDPEFGGTVLSTAPRPGEAAELAGRLVRGHLDYLAPGSVALANVAAVCVGDAPA